MLISFKLTTPTKQIESMMLQAIADEFNKHLATIREIVQAKMVFMVIDRVRRSDVYYELIDGKLKSEFGLTDGQKRLDAIINKWANSFIFTFKKVVPKVRTVAGGFSISGIPGDFQDVLSLAESTLFATGGEVPWLKWLLLEGYKNLIADYSIQYGPSVKSRTNSAIMIKSPGQFYKIPLEFAGTMDDNWITRLFDVDDELEKILTNAIAGVL